jgi:hypothetical protein
MIGFESDEAILQKLRERLRRMTDESSCIDHFTGRQSGYGQRTHPRPSRYWIRRSLGVAGVQEE